MLVADERAMTLAVSPKRRYTVPRDAGGGGDLDAVAAVLNERPRKRSGFATPTEQRAELLWR